MKVKNRKWNSVVCTDHKSCPDACRHNTELWTKNNGSDLRHDGETSHQDDDNPSGSGMIHTTSAKCVLFFIISSTRRWATVVQSRMSLVRIPFPISRWVCFVGITFHPVRSFVSLSTEFGADVRIKNILFCFWNRDFPSVQKESLRLDENCSSHCSKQEQTLL